MENPTAGCRPHNVEKSDICRLCMKTHEYYLNIFVSNEEFKMSIGKAIEDLLVLEVAQGDSLPETVCYSCVTKLMEFRDFKEMSANSARELVGRQMPMGAVTCTVKVEVEDEELSDEGKRDKWNEFSEDQEAAHSSDASETFKTGVQDGDASELHGEHNESGGEDHVKMEDYEGATVYIESSALTVGNQGDVKEEFEEEAMESMVGVECEIAEDVDDKDCPANAISSVESDPLDVGQVVDCCNNIGGVREVVANNFDKLGADRQGMSQNILLINFTCNAMVEGNMQLGYAVTEPTYSRALSSFNVMHQDIVEFECDACGGVFLKKSDLVEHVSIHTGSNAIACRFSGKKLNLKGSLKKHQATDPDVKHFSCDLCGKEFSNKRYLQNHVAAHTDLKRFKCNVCGKTYTRSRNLKNHSVIHTGVKPFKCSECGKMFTEKGVLKRHSVIHSGVKPFKCDACGKTFTEKGSLKRHSVVHTGVKPFKCDVCGRMFTESGGLRSHSLIHTGVKPFECNVCGKLFSVKSNLKTHSVTHTGVKPFKCDVCGKMFTQSTSLKRHSIIHTGV